MNKKEIKHITKHFRISVFENERLKRKARKTGMTEANLIRSLISGYEPKEKPDEEFYDVLGELRSIGHLINQIARKAHVWGFIDEVAYRKQAIRINEVLDMLKKEYLLPRKVKG